MKPEAIRAKKRFGQHFLIDANIIHNIVAAINPKRDDQLVEIGPGPGALTVALLQHVDELQAIELDRDIIPRLQQRCAGRGVLTVHQGDILEFDFSQLVRPPHKLRLVGNLPYNISTPVLFHVFEFIDDIDDMHFMFQKEVAARLVAAPGGKDYGRLSVMAQYFCEVDPLFDVKPECFAPPPKVDSSVVRLKPRRGEAHRARDHGVLERLVQQAFSQRRKTLRNVLKPLFSAEQLRAAGIDPIRRPETLSVAEYVMLANLLAENARGDD